MNPAIAQAVTELALVSIECVAREERVDAQVAYMAECEPLTYAPSIWHPQNPVHTSYAAQLT